MDITRLLAAAGLGLGYVETVSIIFESPASSGYVELGRTRGARGKTYDEAPMSMQPGNVASPVHAVSSSKKPNSALQDDHRTKRAVKRGPGGVAKGSMLTSETAEEAARSRQNELPISSRPLGAMPQMNEPLATGWTHFGHFAFLQEPEPNTVIVVLVGTCVVLVFIIIGILTHFALSTRSHTRRGMIRSARESNDMLQQCAHEQPQLQQEVLQFHPAVEAQASLESFNSLYNLPPGFIERKTPRELEYERRAMSTRMSVYSTLQSPRNHGAHLHPQGALQRESSASG